MHVFWDKKINGKSAAVRWNKTTMRKMKTRSFLSFWDSFSRRHPATSSVSWRPGLFGADVWSSFVCCSADRPSCRTRRAWNIPSWPIARHDETSCEAGSHGFRHSLSRSCRKPCFCETHGEFGRVLEDAAGGFSEMCRLNQCRTYDSILLSVVRRHCDQAGPSHVTCVFSTRHARRCASRCASRCAQFQLAAAGLYFPSPAVARALDRPSFGSNTPTRWVENRSEWHSG